MNLMSSSAPRPARAQRLPDRTWIVSGSESRDRDGRDTECGGRHETARRRAAGRATAERGRHVACSSESRAIATMRRRHRVRPYGAARRHRRPGGWGAGVAGYAARPTFSLEFAAGRHKRYWAGGRPEPVREVGHRAGTGQRGGRGGGMRGGGEPGPGGGGILRGW